MFDNDAEGCAKLHATQGLNLPANMRAVKLPDASQFNQFPTIGPTGPFPADINGKAASIECYLDLTSNAERAAQVRWTSFNREIGVYQGELEQKTEYMKRFLQLRTPERTYDCTKIDAVLDTIVSACVSIAESLQDAESQKAPASIR